MSLWGANLDELRTLESKLRSAADRLDQVRGSVGIGISATPWSGIDRERFVQSWDGSHRAALEFASAALREAALIVESNRHEQERASGVVTGEASVGVPPSEAFLSEGNDPATPIADRFDLNESAARKYLSSLPDGDPFRSLVERRLDMGFELLYFDPEQQYLAWSTGNLGSASKVVVTVSGTGTNWEKATDSFVMEGGYYIQGDTTGTAVVTTMVWSPPDDLGDATTMSDDVSTMTSGPMDSILETVSLSGKSTVLVGHSAGAVAVQQLLIEKPHLVEGLDGVGLLASPDFDSRFPGLLGDKPVFIGQHSDDPILATQADDLRTLLSEWNAPNVSVGNSESGANVLGGTAGAAEGLIFGPGVAPGHGHSNYANNFGDDIHGMFK